MAHHVFVYIAAGMLIVFACIRPIDIHFLWPGLAMLVAEIIRSLQIGGMEDEEADNIQFYLHIWAIPYLLPPIISAAAIAGDFEGNETAEW